MFEEFYNNPEKCADLLAVVKERFTKDTPTENAMRAAMMCLRHYSYVLGGIREDIKALADANLIESVPNYRVAEVALEIVDKRMGMGGLTNEQIEHYTRLAEYYDKKGGHAND